MFIKFNKLNTGGKHATNSKKKGDHMNKQDVIDYLNFRKKFTKREWYELNILIEKREKEIADQIKLTDHDLEIITERAKSIL